MFRANEDSEKLRVAAFDKLLLKESFPWRKSNAGAISADERHRSEHALKVICDRLGPVITSYPEWHPIIAFGREKGFYSRGNIQTTPRFPDIDHNCFLANGFITCPYVNADELISVVKSSYVNLLKYLTNKDSRFDPLSGWLSLAAGSIDLHASYITDELIEALEDGDLSYDDSAVFSDITDLIPLFADSAKPVLIWWKWNKHELEPDGTIPPALAVPLMLSRTLADMAEADFSESWENMRSLLLGTPNGARSSLLLNQLTVKQLRTMFNGLMDSGAFGPKKY